MFFAPMGRFQLESIYLYISWDDGGKKGKLIIKEISIILDYI